MIDKWLQESWFKNLVDRFVTKFLLGRISANSLTIMGLSLGLLSASFIVSSELVNWTLELIIISVILMCISFFIDTLDGAMARLKEPTIFGGILDIFCDRTVEVCILLAIISTNPTILMWPGLFSLSAIILCITIFLLVGGSMKGENLSDDLKLIYYSRGLMERTETFIFLILITVLIAWRCILLWIFACLVFITALQRLRHAYIFFKNAEN